MKSVVKIKNIKRILITVLLGLFFTLIFFEISLFAFGKLERVLKKIQNTIAKRDEFIILALGESTTAPIYDWNLNEYSWPTFLEKLLNDASLGREIKVINKGMSSTNSDKILNDLEKNIEKYDPDLVVSMMGINDFFGEIIYETTANIESNSPFYKLRTYKLIKFLISNLKDKREIKNKEKLDCYSEESCIDLASIQKEKDFFETELAIKFLEKALEYSPKNLDVLINLGFRYISTYNVNRDKDSIKAVIVFEKALEIEPKNPQIYFGLIDALSSTRENIDYVIKTIEHIASSIIHIPSYQINWMKYIMNYRALWKEKIISSHTTIEENIKKYEISDKDVFLALTGLLLSYEDVIPSEGQTVVLCLEKALAVEPNDPNVSFDLARYHAQHNNLKEAEQFYLKVLESGEKDGIYIIVLIELANLYLNTDRQELASEIFEQAINIGGMYVKNYQQLYKILKSKDIKLIAAQYPMRSSEPLELIFKDKNDVLLVDNEFVFKNAVKEKSYEQIFIDRFAGDFGHCSEEGNILLAKNIASVILDNWKEISGEN